MSRIDGIDPAHAGFANKLRQLLQVMSMDRHEYGQRQGKLVNPHLYKVVINKPGYSDRVFKKTTKNRTLDVCVSLVCDLSGSMSGSKWEMVQQAIVLINHAVGNVLRVPLEVSTFTTAGSIFGGDETNLVHILRRFENTTVSTDVMQERMVKASRKGFRNNMDGEAVSLAYDRIRRRREPRRIMIVLSDGQPACYRGGDYVGYLREVVQDIERRKQVEIYGFGVISNEVKGFYTKNTSCFSVNELDIHLLKLLKHAIVSSSI